MFSASVRPHILDEQEAFIRQVTKIPLDQRKCQDLITLDTLHAYCGGLESTPVVRKLNAYSHRRKYPLISPINFLFVVSWSNIGHLFFAEMEAARQRAHVWAAAAWRKEEEKAKGKEGASLSTLRAIGKGMFKRKADEKDDCLSKKVSITPRGEAS